MAEALTKKKLTESVREKIHELFSEIEFIDHLEIKHEIREGQGPDLVVEFSGKSGIHVLLVEIRTSGEPRLAREAVDALLAEMRLWSHAHPVFAAPYISRESAEICRQNHVGYVDIAGNCHLGFDSVYIHSEGKPNPYKTKRRLRSLARPKSGRIVRVLLSNPHREWKTQELAREANVSMGLVSNVKKILKDREWIDGKMRKIVLIRPWDLLEEWIANTPKIPAESVKYYHIPLDFVGIENMIVEHCRRKNLRFAFTGLSGAVHLAPDVNYRQVQVHVSGEMDSFMKESGFDKFSGESNLAILKGGDRGVFYKTRLVLPVSRLQYYSPSEKQVKAIEAEIGVRILIASPVQIYFDLKSTFKGYSEEAEKVFQQVLQTSW